MMEDTKLVYAFNLLTGVYEGPRILDSTDRSPISGSWQIPCNMVEVAPPEIPEGHECTWDGTQWVIKEIEGSGEPQIPGSTTPSPTLSDRITVLEDDVHTLMEGVSNQWAHLEEINPPVYYLDSDGYLCEKIFVEVTE